MPHLPAGSSSPSGQSFFLSQTLASGIQSPPPPQSKCVLRSQIVEFFAPPVPNLHLNLINMLAVN